MVLGQRPICVDEWTGHQRVDIWSVTCWMHQTESTWSFTGPINTNGNKTIGRLGKLCGNPTNSALYCTKCNRPPTNKPTYHSKGYGIVTTSVTVRRGGGNVFVCLFVSKDNAELWVHFYEVSGTGRLWTTKKLVKFRKWSKNTGIILWYL